MNRAAETAAQALAGTSLALAPYVAPGRAVDAIGRQVPRNPLAGAAGSAWLLRLPGFARQFERAVPAEYVMGYAVVCVCGSVHALDVGELAECPGGCGRWFLRTGEGMRVARWPVEVEPDEVADARLAREAMGRGEANG